MIASRRPALLLSTLCWIGLIASLASCGGVPRPSGTPAASPFAVDTPSPSPVPVYTVEPASPTPSSCASPSIVGKLDLLPLPATVREPVSMARWRPQLRP